MNQSNRRRSPRYETEVEATISVKDHQISSSMIDISERGIGVVAGEPIYPGTEVYITLTHIEDYCLYGIVRWSQVYRKGNKTYYRMGIETEILVLRSNGGGMVTSDRTEFLSMVISKGNE